MQSLVCMCIQVLFRLNTTDNLTSPTGCPGFISAERITHRIPKNPQEDYDEKRDDGRHHIADIEQIQHLGRDHLTMTNISLF